MTSVAINGLGRLGRTALRIIGETPELELAAVNDLVKVIAWYDNPWGYASQMIRKAVRIGTHGRA